ncbi:MAG: MarR family transcriptional regulator [Dorea sp.]|nr:MarR family transcriptional regulator [Dorea sp.]
MNFPIKNALKEYNHIYKETNRIYHDIALKLKLSDSAFDILYAVCQLGDGCLQRDICSLSATSKQTINSSIRKLEREGHIILKPGKGRQMHIFLTETGMELAKERIFPVIEIENKVFDSLTEEESRELLRLSRKYIEILEKNAKEFL